jgi:hypothetical protein
MKDVTQLNIVLFFTTLEQLECSSESSSSSDDLLESDDSKQNENKKRTIAASWATYRRMRAEGKIGDMPLKLTPMRKKDQLIKYDDDNGLLFAPICKPANDDDVKCFDSSKNKTCAHKVDKVALNEVGQYVVFPSRWWHRGFYEIRSEKEYYTVQLFCTATQDPQSWTNQLRKQNRNMKIGRIPVQQIKEVSKDIQDNWETTYAVTKFPPSKAFDGDKIDPNTNRHLQGDTFQKIPHMDSLVKYFESRFTQFHVKSVWIIKKTRENDGFQVWHRDFYLNTDIISTIVVNVGVCEMK